jgi:hypothetical protein
MDEEKRKIKIEQCATKRTKFFFNGNPHRLSPEKLMEMFSMTPVEMNKLHMGYVVEKTMPKSEFDTIFKELDNLDKLSIT